MSVVIDVGPKESAFLMGVLLDPARSAEPPHSSGSVAARAWMASAEALRVATPLGSASQVGRSASHPSGSWPE